MDNVWSEELPLKLLAELIKGDSGIVLSRFHLYWTNVMGIGQLRLLNKEVYLHTVVGIGARVITVEVQAMSARHKHLCHNVLNQHTRVDLQLVEHEFLIQFLALNGLLVKGM